MRRSVWMRVLAAVLIISMLAAPVSAAASRPSPSYGTNCIVGGIISIIRDIIRDIWDDWFDVPGDEDPEPTPPEQPTDPSEPTEPDETEPEDPTEPEETLKTVLNLIEGHANTENGHLLRGVTYSLSQLDEEQSKPESTPGSLRDIKAIAIGAARAAAPTAQLNAAASSVQPMAATVNTEYGFNNWVDGGQYYIQSARADKNTSPNSYLKGAVSGVTGVPLENASLWTLDIVSSTVCYLSTEIDGTTYYLAIDSEAESLKTTASNLTITTCIDNTDYVDGDGNQLQVCGVKYLNQSGLTTEYRGENNADDSGNAMWFYLVDGENLTKVTVAATDDSRDIPTDVMAATAGDSHNDNLLPGNTLDNNTSTIWHTNWYGTNRDNHWIQFQLSADYKVDGLRYLPRQSGGSNGTITRYEVQVSNDGVTFSTVASGTWANDTSWKGAYFSAENVKFVRLVVLDAASDNSYVFASAAEIRLTGEKVSDGTEEDIKLVYFPVTMFNYDMDTMNEKTISMYPDGSTLYNGIHFSDGKPGGNVTYAVTAHTGEYTNGQYVIQSYRQKDDGQPSWLSFSTEGEKGIFSVSDQADAAIWTLTRVPGANVFTLTTEVDGTTYYMTFGNETSGITTEYSEITLVYYTHTNAGIQITKDGYYLAHSEGNLFCGSTNSTSTSNGMGFFPVAEDGTIGTTARTVTTINGAVTSGFSRWNWWSYLEDGNAAQNKFFAELVQHELDSNGDIVFNVPEPGIFKTGTGDNIAEKDVYTNVGLPFVLGEDGIYTFDSDTNGVYFPDTDGDGDTDPQSGTDTEPYKLTFDPGAPQGWSGMNYGDGSSNLWAPFNTNTNDTGEGAIDYHFGMRADIPFSMTPNGRIKSTDDNSTPITFTFSGDDDVWIFIDGHLVIDLGGIHNRIGATIDFANNTITYFLPESNTNTSELGCYNDRTRYPVTVDENGKQTITVKLYNDAEGEGSLGQTRNDFASEEAHTMSIFYMERGKGTSNCHIEFNLPMRDTVLITKDASKSWSEAKDKEDEDGDGTDYLTAKEQAAVDKLNFGFTLYKKTADETEFTAVTNTNFFVQDKTGKVIATSSTDGNGKFYLKNGQTAKFMTDIPKEGITYYVVEDAVPEGFLTPDYKYAGAATWGYDYIGEAILKDENGDYILDAEGNLTSGIVSGTATNAAEMGEHELPMDATENKSYEVTVKGSVESIDSIEFICTNYLDAELPNPSALANEDIIVIDYGLPVQIDPLANDLFRGDNIEIVAWGDESLTLNEVKDEHGNAIPYGTEGGTSWRGDNIVTVADQGNTGAVPFDSGNVTFNDVTYAETTDADGTTTFVRDSFEYKLTEQLTEVETIHYIIKVTATETNTATNITTTVCRYSLAKVYIVPATIMYYEENFSDMVTFEGAGWDAASTVADAGNVSDYQEPGVVGTVGDSTYGSDVAYLSDDGDSNGTYRFGDTTNKAIRFTYTFTGTGSSIFARTSAETGYMQIKLYEGTTTDEAFKNNDYMEIAYRDTYWKYLNGNDLASDDYLYNIPVYTTENLKYGTYTIVCTVAKAGTRTEGNENGAGNQFYLDGIRVMQPLNGVLGYDEETDEVYYNPIEDLDPITAKGVGAYATDGESNLQVLTLRQKLITEYDYLVPEEDENGEMIGEEEVNWPFAVLTDINGKIILASDYISIGPKEEVYLSAETDTTNAQTVSFSLKSWEPEGLKLYMGMKAPFGHAMVNVGDHAIELKNAPDCYYDVTNFGTMTEVTDESGETYHVITFTFKATESIVSLTNIKVVGSFEFAIIENPDEEVDGSEGGN